MSHSPPTAQVCAACSVLLSSLVRPLALSFLFFPHSHPLLSYFQSTNPHIAFTTKVLVPIAYTPPPPPHTLPHTPHKHIMSSYTGYVSFPWAAHIHGEDSDPAACWPLPKGAKHRRGVSHIVYILHDELF